MIKTYIKFELRSTWKPNTLFVGIPAIITFLLCISLTFFYITHDLNTDTLTLLVELLGIISFLLKILSLCAVVIYFFIRYHKTMHGKERCFSYMLPMTRQQIFIGKWLSLSIWLFLSFAMLLIDLGFYDFLNIWEYFHTDDYSEFVTMLPAYFIILLVAILLSLFVAFHSISIINISPLWKAGTVLGAIITCIIVSIARKCLYFVLSFISILPMLFLLPSNSLLFVINILFAAGIIGIVGTELIIIIVFTLLNKHTFKKDI